MSRRRGFGGLIIGILLAVIGYLGYRVYTCDCPEILQNAEPIRIIETKRDTALQPIDVIATTPMNVTQVKSAKVRNNPIKTLAGNKNTYVVTDKFEDRNLYRIALKFNTSWERLMDLNNMQTSNIEIGQRLYIGTVAERYVEPVDNLHDSTYYYEEYYGDSMLNATVTTVSAGPLFTQTVELNSEPIYVDIPKRTFFGVGGIGTYPSLMYGIGMQDKKGYVYSIDHQLFIDTRPAFNIRVMIPLGN